jgi:hypothetical protein
MPVITKKIIIIVNLIASLVLISCNSNSDEKSTLANLRKNLISGNLEKITRIADSINTSPQADLLLRFVADSANQIAERISLDFSVNEEKVMSQIEKRIGSFTSSEKEEWERKGWLEFRNINGKKMYFNRAASNLMLIRSFSEQRKKMESDIANDPRIKARLKNTTEVLTENRGTNQPAAPVNMKITYTLTVNKDVVPDGELIRCWLPFPKSGNIRQQEIKLLETSDPVYIISPDSAIHKTLYLEGKAKTGITTVFKISFTYQSFAQHFDLKNSNIQPYNKSEQLYKKYTSEEKPQILFSPKVKKLTDSITGKEENPLIIINKIYSWFKENITWAGAQEYSIMPDIPMYVIEHRRGDCGMQTFLYMSMLRYKGIPVRWQSGWMVPPGAENLHDWCEIYLEGVGWVPSDISYDTQNSEKPELHDYFMSGLDSYRLIVNDGISGPLLPEKKYMRSEPYDFQRGEVEWKGGNLYFDKWDYHMDIEYLNP